MENIRFVPTVLNVVYEKGSPQDAPFLQEYYALMKINDDPLGLWLKSSKIRKASEESDQVLLTLLLELHRKVDKLTHVLTSDKPLLLTLEHSAILGAIGHGYVRFDSDVLVMNETYYARIDMPIFPQRHIPLFIEAIDECVGKIVLMHEDDEDDWSTYMMACERAMIRQMKGNGSEY